LERASIGALELKQLFSLIVPKLFGYAQGANATEALSAPFYLASGAYSYWETAFYCGIPAFVLGIIGFAVSVRKRECAGSRENMGGFLLFASVFAILFALGTNGFLFEWMFKVPLFDRFRIPSRMLVYVVLALAILSGVGLDEILLRGKAHIRLLLIVSGTVLGVALLVALGILPALLGTPPANVAAVRGFGWIAVVFAFLTSGVLYFAASQTQSVVSSIAIASVVAALVMIDLTLQGSTFNADRTDPAAEYARTDAAVPRTFRADTVPPDSLVRLSIRARGVMAMGQNQGLITPVMLYEGYMPILIERRLPLAPTGEKTLDLLNIRYAVAVDTMRGSAYFAERPTAYPRARMLYNVRQSSPEASGEIAKSGTIDFDNELITEHTLPFAMPNVKPGAVQHTVKCEQYSANALTYTVQSAENGVLLLSEIWYPAWKATLDGRPCEILRVDYSLRGVAVPKGKHTVRMVYDSFAFRTGAWVSIGTIIVVAIGLIVLQVGRKDTEKA
jgi:hypothetical protein